MNDALSSRLRALSDWAYVLSLLTASFIVVLPFVFLQLVAPQLEAGPGSATMQALGPAGRFVFGCIAGPVLETAMFQWAPIRLLRGKFKLPWRLVLFLSAASFAATHSYSLGYVVFAFLVGLVLAYCFALKSEPPHRPFLLTFLVHALRNGIAIILH